MNSTVRTRFAPSPTGTDAHVGTAYTALLNWAFAKKNGGRLILRLEDTDQSRYVPEFEENFKSSMVWLGLDWDEGPDIGGYFGPYRQSERLDLYKSRALELVEREAAYFCFCGKERLEELRRDQNLKGQITRYDGRCRSLTVKDSRQRYENDERTVVRLKVPEGGKTEFKDEVRGEVVFENRQIDDQILLKSDGYPTYHLAVVVDDHLMEISHVIRAEEWLSSTPKQVLIYQAFGWSVPVWAHTPILRNPDKSKLSKRNNPAWVSWFRQQGFLAEALLNFLALQAWSHPDGRDIFDLDEFIEKFSLERLSKTGPSFDLKKLEWMNGQWIRRTQDSRLKTQIYKFLAGRRTENQIEKALPLVKERMHKLSDFEPLVGFLFEAPSEVKSSETPNLKRLLAVLQELERPWTKEDWETKLKGLAAEDQVKPGDIFMELRLAISGSRVGPDLWQSIEFLGGKEILERLKKLLSQSL